MKYKILIAILVATAYFYCDNKREEALQKQRVTDLGLQLRGVITNKLERERGKGYGVLHVKILESNITHYDMRGKEPYFCYINGDSALFYVSSRRAVVGDTIQLNTNSNYVYNTKGEISFTTEIITWSDYWEKVKKSGY